MFLFPHSCLLCHCLLLCFSLLHTSSTVLCSLFTFCMPRVKSGKKVIGCLCLQRGHLCVSAITRDNVESGSPEKHGARMWSEDVERSRAMMSHQLLWESAATLVGV